MRRLLAFTAVAVSSFLIATTPASAWYITLKSSVTCVNGTSTATIVFDNTSEPEPATIRASSHPLVIAVGTQIPKKGKLTRTAPTPITLTVTVNWPSDTKLRTYTTTAKAITCQTTTTLKPTTTTTVLVATTTTVPPTTTTVPPTTAPTTTSTTIVVTTSSTSSTSTSTTVPPATTSSSVTSTSVTVPETTTSLYTSTSIPASNTPLADTGFSLVHWLSFGLLLVVAGFSLCLRFRQR